jgi:UDP-N-acetyl-D-mannosaminuronic acid dehydrogenase
MTLAELKKKIESKDALLAVIGLGYVGLPVAASFARAGFNVLGVELLTERVDKINRGENPIEGEEPGLTDLLKAVATPGKLHAVSDYGALRDRDVILIAVETPVDSDHKPRYQALKNALESLAANLKQHALVIIESTIAPGTMRNLVQATLEQRSGKQAGMDFFLGNCPERVMPGKLLANLRKLDRVVGGMTPETAETMVVLYRHIVEGELDPTDCITAELVKTVENAYRDVQIAFANEVALISEAVGGDVWKVRELVNKSPGRHMLLPGAGVGGHCIPKDPWLLASAVDGKEIPLRLIPAARAVNDGMPGHMVELLKKGLAESGKSLKGARILVMGYAYLENSDDTRNSPSAAVVTELGKAGATAVIHDPYVKAYQGDLLDMAKGCDAAVLMVKHDKYKEIAFPDLRDSLNNGLLIDSRRLYDAAKAVNSDLKLYQLGIGMDLNSN